MGLGGGEVGPLGNVYVAGCQIGNVFRITPGGEITEIIDGYAGGTTDQYALYDPNYLDADPTGETVFVAGRYSQNAYRIELPEPGTTAGLITGALALATMKRRDRIARRGASLSGGPRS